MNKLKELIVRTGVPKQIVEIYTRRQYKKMVSVLDLGYPKSVLEIGSSYGLFARAIKDKLKINDYTCLDIDRNILMEGQRKNKDIKFVLGNAEKLAFKNKSFDLVICKDVLHHCNYPRKVVSEVNRVGKKFIIIEARRGDKWLDHFLKEHNHFTEEKFKEIVNMKRITYLNILWPMLLIMVFLIFLPKIPESPKAFMVAQN
jgi:ubiquinone/menaquinone biosynthesis C-methylase UbiE